MKLKNIIHIAAVCGMAGCLAACSDSEPTTVYIPEARSLNIVNFDLAEPMSQTFHVAVTASDYVTTSGLDVSSDVTVTLSVDPAKVEAYNSACGTDYEILPADCYTLPENAVIPAGATSSDDLTVNVDARGKIQPFDSYLLPVTISAVSGADINPQQSTVYYLMSGAEDVWNMPLADRSDWKVVEVSSEETSGEGSDNGHAIHAFDGDLGTFWHTQWKGGEPQPPHHIVVDMGQEVRMLGFQYVSRNHGEGWPQEMTLETSLDGENWEGAGTYSDLPAEGGAEFRSYLPGFKQARYFRLTITAVYNGKWSTHVAEINAISIVK